METMVLSPIDIEQKTFRVALRGYAEEEVDQFLDEVVISIREYERQLRDANERVAVLEEQLEANRDSEDRIKKTLVIAQRTADQVVQEARAEAQQLLTEARERASDVEIERIRERENLVADLDQMRSSVAELKERIVGLADSTLGGLDAIEEDIVAVQPEPAEVPSWDGELLDPGEAVDDEVDVDLPDDAGGPVDEDEDVAVDEDDTELVEAEAEAAEEGTGQVFLGSGNRPWDRDQPESETS
jgi:cell division initiation protein